MKKSFIGTLEREITGLPVVLESVDRIMGYYQISTYFIPVSRYPTNTDVLDGEMGCLFLETDGRILPVVRVCQEKPNKAGRLV